MTPTLGGRIQTRILLMLLIGLPIGLCFGLMMGNVLKALVWLGLALALGLLLDPLYHHAQHRRWDRDWPTLFMVLAGCLEGGLLWLFLQIVTRWPVEALSPFFVITNTQFLRMYSTIWVAMLLANLGPLNIFFPYRRFKGGKFRD